MDFVDQLFGRSQDGGSGPYEIALVFLVSAALAVLALRRVTRRR